MISKALLLSVTHHHPAVMYYQILAVEWMCWGQPKQQDQNSKGTDMLGGRETGRERERKREGGTKAGKAEGGRGLSGPTRSNRTIFK